MMEEQFDSRDVARYLMALALGLQEAPTHGMAKAKAVDILKKALWMTAAVLLLERDLENKNEKV